VKDFFSDGEDVIEREAMGWFCWAKSAGFVSLYVRTFFRCNTS
jgi:hypothetical protein